MNRKSFIVKKKDIKTKTAALLQSDGTFKAIVITVVGEDSFNVYQSKASFNNRISALDKAHYYNANSFLRELTPDTCELLFNHINLIELNQKGIN